MVNDVARVVVEMEAWVAPLGTLLAYQVVRPLYVRSPPTSWARMIYEHQQVKGGIGVEKARWLTVKVVAVDTDEAHVRTLLLTAHLPLLDVRVKPEPRGKMSTYPQRDRDSEKLYRMG